MGALLTSWRRIDGAVALVETVVAVAALALILVLTFAPIVVRLVGANAAEIAWTTPLSLYLLLTSTFFGASLGVRSRRHIQIDLVTRALPPRGKAAFGAVGGVIAAALMGLLCFAAIHYARVNWEQASKLRDVTLGSINVREVPLGPVTLAMPIALAIMSIRFLMGGVEDLRGALTGDLDYRKHFEHSGEAGHALAAAHASPAPGAPIPVSEAAELPPDVDIEGKDEAKEEGPRT